MDDHKPVAIRISLGEKSLDWRVAPNYNGREVTEQDCLRAVRHIWQTLKKHEHTTEADTGEIFS